jgi:hypothetical protein
MVALVPDHVLEEQDGMIVVEVHGVAGLHPALHRVAHHLGAVIQHLRDAARFTLPQPFFLGQVSGELGGVLGDEHQPHIVDVREHLRDGWAALHGSDFQSFLREDAKQVEQNGIVPVPGIEQDFKQASTLCVRHFTPRWLMRDLLRFFYVGIVPLFQSNLDQGKNRTWKSLGAPSICFRQAALNLPLSYLPFAMTKWVALGVEIRSLH